MVLLKFENMKRDERYWWNLLQIRLLFLFTTPHEVVCKNFVYFLGTPNLRNNSLLIRTISIVCTIPCQRRFVPNSIFIGVVLERSLYENSCSESFLKNRRSDKWRIYFLLKFHDELCLTACLNKIKVLIGKHFFSATLRRI